MTAYLAEKHSATRFDVVVVDGAEALRFALQHRAEIFPDVPAVFMNVTSAEVERIRPPPDVTGVLLALEGQRTLEVALDLQPGTKLVAVVGGATAADRRNVDLARSAALARAPDLEVSSLVEMPLDEQLRRVSTLPPHSIVYFASFRADILGRSMVARDVLRLVARAANAPTFAASDSWLGYGIVGGDLTRSDVPPARAAALTARLLRGEPIASMPPMPERSSALMFDWRELRRWGIDEGRLPTGSLVLFREASFWMDHKWALSGGAAVLLGQGLLVAALLVERRSRRRARAGLAEAERRYRTVADFTSDWEVLDSP